MPDTRIGVFVCHCGRNIGGYVDVPQVVEYAKNLPDVAHAEHNLYTCSEEGISSIKRKIQENDLNRVLVASCTPRTHEPLFRSACQEAGLNKYLFEFVNIRDQCSWVHMNLPKEATEKAKALIRMGVAKARLLEPLEEIEIEVTPSCLVIGAGAAGMTAALNLANQGFDVHLVEKRAELGGLLRGLHKLFAGNQDAGEFIVPLINHVRDHEHITTHLSTKVKEVKGFIGNFDVTLDHGQKESAVSVGTIIVAVGADEFKPAGQYGYGETPGVLTQLELEERMKEGTLRAKNVVMINCVGARVPERPYCSRFCCVTAIKNAVLIKENDPEANVWILHRDLMAYGVEFEDYYRKAMQLGVRFVRYSLDSLPEVIMDGEVEGVRVRHQLMGKQVELPSDMVVLTTPLVPREENAEISKMLKVPLSSEGFFLEAHLKLRPVEFATDGIFICGSARWPVEVSEAVFQAYASAAKAAMPMRRGYVCPEAITSFVNEEFCGGCGICAVLCPYSAMLMEAKNGKRVAHSIEALCKGCGTCGAACPSGAIAMNHFTDKQILAQIDALAEA
jgi:heterodisulfide reductase subunit A